MTFASGDWIVTVQDTVGGVPQLKVILLGAFFLRLGVVYAESWIVPKYSSIFARTFSRLLGAWNLVILHVPWIWTPIIVYTIHLHRRSHYTNHL